MEDSELTPKEIDAEESSSEINEKIKNQDKDKAFSEFLQTAANQNAEKEEIKVKSQEEIDSRKSLFKRFLNEGFDGISKNPNYKMLGLLIILLINLSLFFVIGNIGKTFLKNAGIM